MFFAGTDSTYTLLEWVMTELLRHPKCMKILQNEVRAITGRKLYANEDDLEQIKYLKAVIKETLRLHPPVPFLAPRQSIHDIKIKGYDIPVNVGVFINAWAIHRDPATWDKPDKFIPERFLNFPIDFRGQDFQFIPFGAGRRICPGITFAIAVNELVLANLMHKFDWTLPDGTDVENLDMSESIGITAHKKIARVATPLNAGK